MSKFIEVTAGTKVLINTSEIACIEPTEDYKDGKFITKESYEEVKQMIIGTK